MEGAIPKPEVPARFGNYRRICCIGEGSFAEVALVRREKENRKPGEEEQLYACKAYSKSLLGNDMLAERFEREVRVIEYLNHENVIKMSEVVYSEDHVFVVMELCKLGDLYGFLSERGRIDEETAYKIFKQILTGVEYLHNRGIVHRDIKLDNILLTDSMTVKIADFGLCHEVKGNQRLRTPCGSPLYTAPEILNEQEYDGKKSDIWSLGIVLFALATGCLPWSSGSTDSEIIAQITSGIYHVPSHVPPLLRDLLVKMMSRDPELRPTIDEIWNDPWMKTMKKRVEGVEITKLRLPCHQAKRRGTYGAVARPVHIEVKKGRHVVRPDMKKTQTMEKLIRTPVRDTALSRRASCAVAKVKAEVLWNPTPKQPSIISEDIMKSMILPPFTLDVPM